jgi:hypothetical protein
MQRQCADLDETTINCDAPKVGQRTNVDDQIWNKQAKIQRRQ